jgi:hypothetical protein
VSLAIHHLNNLGSIDEILFCARSWRKASIAQLGERQTEDLKARCSIHRRSNLLIFMIRHYVAPSLLNIACIDNEDLGYSQLKPLTKETTVKG